MINVVSVSPPLLIAIICRIISTISSGLKPGFPHYFKPEAGIEFITSYITQVIAGFIKE